MAGSRLEKVGTVFTRIRDLLRSGVLKPSEKPIWYDVYEAFPPKREPLYVKARNRAYTQTEDTVPEIFYREDEIRGMFYENYGTGSRPFDLFKTKFVSSCQRFVEKYTELQRTTELDESALFDETCKALFSEGIMLRRRGAPPVSAKARDPVLGLKLKDMLAEHQSEHNTHTIDPSNSRTI